MTSACYTALSASSSAIKMPRRAYAGRSAMNCCSSSLFTASSHTATVSSQAHAVK